MYVMLCMLRSTPKTSLQKYIILVEKKSIEKYESYYPLYILGVSTTYGQSINKKKDNKTESRPVSGVSRGVVDSSCFLGAGADTGPCITPHHLCFPFCVCTCYE